jgi:3-deoxy-manno-octulosonate cytidylyltransferase (CMP-KDO synthetase)
MKTAIIIPSHLNAKRLPKKPLLLINNEPMILHVWRQAKKTNIENIIVATSDQEIFDVIVKHGGKSIMTSNNHTNGSDRIFEAVNTLESKPELIINVQGDMPLINPESINFLDKFMRDQLPDIATLASNLDKQDIENPNIVKVKTEMEITSEIFSPAVDFFRTKNEMTKNLYHHVGIYAYRYPVLRNYVGLHKTKNELERSLEQMRALDNNIKIQVGFIRDYPLGVDTQEDLEKIRLLFHEK